MTQSMSEPLVTPSILSRGARLAALWRRSGFRHLRLASLRPPFSIAIRGNRASLLCDGGASAKTCYREVVVEDCYRIFRLPRSFQPEQIVDIGANIGTFSKLCTVIFPTARIHAYEPDPGAFAWLEKNAAGTRIAAHPSAVAKVDGTVAFDPGPDSGLGRVDASGVLSVPAVGAARVGESGPIDLLKLDCEGGEWAILETPELLLRTRRLCLEYHLTDDHNLAELENRLAAGGHEITWLDDQPQTRSGHLASIRR